MFLEFPYSYTLAHKMHKSLLKTSLTFSFQSQSKPDLQAHDTSTTRNLRTMAIQQMFMKALCCIPGVLPLKKKQILGEDIYREIALQSQ